MCPKEKRMARSLFGTTEPTPAAIAAATATELGDELTLILRGTKQIRERLEGSMDNMVKDLFSRLEAMCPTKLGEDLASLSETTKNITARLDGLMPGTDMAAMYQHTKDIAKRIDGFAWTQDLERILEKLDKPGHSRGSKSTSSTSGPRWRLRSGPRRWPPPPPSPPM